MPPCQFLISPHALSLKSGCMVTVNLFESKDPSWVQIFVQVVGYHVGGFIQELVRTKESCLIAMVTHGVEDDVKGKIFVGMVQL